MFKEVFADLESVLPGLRSVAVVGDDGIEVGSHVRQSFPHEALSAEMNGVLRLFDRLRTELELGTVSEMVVRSSTQNILLFALPDGLFVLLVTDPEETTGRTRYQVQRHVSQFIQALS